MSGPLCSNLYMEPAEIILDIHDCSYRYLSILFRAAHDIAHGYLIV